MEKFFSVDERENDRLKVEQLNQQSRRPTPKKVFTLEPL
jgi:hypothetical protein